MDYEYVILRFYPSIHLWIVTSANIIYKALTSFKCLNVQGDSGGPLLKWLGDQAVVVGVVSRGASCAEENQAGVYTRVKTKLRFSEQ